MHCLRCGSLMMERDGELTWSVSGAALSVHAPPAPAGHRPPGLRCHHVRGDGRPPPYAYLVRMVWRTRMLRLRQAIRVCVVAGVLASCSSAAPPTAPTAGEASPLQSLYFVTGAPGWPAAKEAYKPRPDDPITSRSEPTLDWYAEHERFRDPSHSQAVRLSGHHVPIAQLESSLTGLKLRSRPVRGVQARAGSAPGGPQIVLLPVSPRYTVMVLSYELNIEELIEWTKALRAVDEAGWLAAGGVIAP